MDENFKEFIGRLANLCIEHGDDPERAILQTFFKMDAYLEDIPITGIP
jgi:hypothetical protein